VTFQTHTSYGKTKSLNHERTGLCCERSRGLPQFWDERGPTRDVLSLWGDLCFWTEGGRVPCGDFLPGVHVCWGLFLTFGWRYLLFITLPTSSNSPTTSANSSPDVLWPTPSHPVPSQASAECVLVRIRGQRWFIGRIHVLRRAFTSRGCTFVWGFGSRGFVQCLSPFSIFWILTSAFSFGLQFEFLVNNLRKLGFWRFFTHLSILFMTMNYESRTKDLCMCCFKGQYLTILCQDLTF